jgi:hypothetical protein
MTSTIIRAALGVAAAAALMAGTSTAAHAAELYDTSSPTQPQFTVVADPSETPGLLASDYGTYLDEPSNDICVSLSSTLARDHHYGMNATNCANSLIYCARNLPDTTHYVPAITWTPHPGSRVEGDYRCINELSGPSGLAYLVYLTMHAGEGAVG